MSCVVAKHEMWTSDYITQLFRISLPVLLGFSGPATGVFWALRAQSGKEFKISSRGLSAPGVQTVQSGVKNESKSTIFQLF